MRITLRTKAAWLAGSLSLVFVGTTSPWQYGRLSAEYIALLREQQQTLTRALAFGIDDKLGRHVELLERAAHGLGADIETETNTDTDSFHDSSPPRQWVERSALRPMFDGVSWIDLDGAVLASDPPAQAWSEAVDRVAFQKVIASGSPAISAPYLSRVAQAPAIWIGVPVRDRSGRLEGVIGAELDLRRSDLFGGLALAQGDHSGSVVVETGGTTPIFVKHPDPARLLQPVERASPVGQGREPSDGMTSAPVQAADWTLRVVAPADRTLAPIAELRNALLAQAMLLGLGCGLLVWFGTAWLMRPLERLLHAIRVLRQFPESAVVLDVGAHDDSGELAREIDALMSELRDKRVEMAAVTDASPLGLFRCDAEGRMIYVNDAYLTLHGLDRSEAADGWLSLIPEAIRAEVWAEWARRVKDDQPFNATSWLHRRDGSKIFVSVHLRPISVGGIVMGHVGALSDITERTRAAQALRTLTAVFEATTDYVVQIDKLGGVTYMNPAARRRAGMAADAPVSGLTMADLAPTRTVERLRDEIVPAALKDGVWVGESTIWDDAQACFPVSQMVIAHRNRNHKIERFSAIMRDISEAKATEQALRESEARLRTIADALPMRVAYVDTKARYRFVNLACERQLDLRREDIVGRTVQEVLGQAGYTAVAPHLRAALRGEHVVFQSERTSGDDRVYDEAQYIPQISADGSSVVGFHAVTTDITQQKREEIRLLELASNDPLTGLGNRVAFETRLSEAMARNRERRTVSALLYLDIDHFKQVNDRHGHPVGDALLKAAAQRISCAIRQADFAARIGGDEFNVLMQAVPNFDVAHRVAHKILAALAEPFVLADHTLRVSTSIGVAFFDGDDATAEQWIGKADAMLYRAKAAGRNNVQMASAPATLSA